ncbi:hypothetical protein SLA2020_257940, partial [Shorea laevis]
MEEDSPNFTKSSDTNAGDDPMMEEQQGFGPCMLVERKKNRRKLGGRVFGSMNQQSNPNPSNRGNSSNQLIESQGGSKQCDELANSSANKALNEPNGNINGSIVTNGLMTQFESQGPKLSVKQISSNGTPLSHTNSDPIMLQDSHGLPQDSAKSKDSSTTRSKGICKED